MRFKSHPLRQESYEPRVASSPTRRRSPLLCWRAAPYCLATVCWWVGEGSLRLPGGSGETVQFPPSPQVSRASSPIQPRSTRPVRVVGAGTPAAIVTGRGRLRFGSGAFAAKIPFGGMVERTKAAVLKTVGSVLPVPWVRIPLPPPMSYEFRVASSPSRRRSSLRCLGVEPYCPAASVPRSGRSKHGSVVLDR